MSEEQLDNLIAAIRAVAHGDTVSPGGLESLGMALAGQGLERPISHALDGIAEALMEVAAAIRESKEAT